MLALLSQWPNYRKGTVTVLVVANIHGAHLGAGHIADPRRRSSGFTLFWMK